MRRKRPTQKKARNGLEVQVEAERSGHLPKNRLVKLLQETLEKAGLEGKFLCRVQGPSEKSKDGITASMVTPKGQVKLNARVKGRAYECLLVVPTGISAQVVCKILRGE